MNRSVKHLQAYTLVARDGELGSVEEMYFDDEKWTIRYIIANLEEVPDKEWAAVSPVSVEGVDWKNGTIMVDLSREDVAGSPELDLEEPMGREKERQLNRYYRIPVYWNGVGLWGNHVYPGLLAEESVAAEEDGSDRETRVHGTREAFGYTIEATDGEIGRVDDLVVEERTWEIQFLVIDTGNWLSGRKVIVDTHWIDQVNWQDGRVAVSLPRNAIRSATAI
ncbi:MAG: PRC-barrel domain-containing protein [Spirochaetales bacterium]|nr:PRC-barrel domain-containing protein [Spirochaetales bacterium]